MFTENKPRFGPIPNYPLAAEKKISIGKRPVIVAGPCSLESYSQIDKVLSEIYDEIDYFRGGVFRAGTYPGKDWGWKMSLLKYSHALCNKLNIKNVVDVLDIRDLYKINPYTDVFQVGMRQAQHYALLKELGKYQKPVFYKRGSWMTYDETMGGIEYLLKSGIEKLTIIERGSVSFMDHGRWELSISLIAKVKQSSGIPIIVDASHGTGVRSLVKPLTLAGIAAGADGCLLECHPDPENSLSDKQQALSIDEFRDIKKAVLRLCE